MRMARLLAVVAQMGGDKVKCEFAEGINLNTANSVIVQFSFVPDIIILHANRLSILYTYIYSRETAASFSTDMKIRGELTDNTLTLIKREGGTGSPPNSVMVLALQGLTSATVTPIEEA